MGFGSILSAAGNIASVVTGNPVWSVAGNTVGGIIGGDEATNDALDAQKQAASTADATQRYMYDTTRADNMPAITSRNWALDQLKAKLGGKLGGAVNPGDVTQEAGYQFGLNQGQSSLNRQLAARGMLNSGAALKAASRYGNDYATTKYDNAFNREIANRSAQLNPLQSLAGLGQTGASTIAGAGQNYANQVSSNALGLGNAQASAGINNALNNQNLMNQGIGWYMNSGKNSNPLGSLGNWLQGQYSTAGSGNYGSAWSASNPFEL